MELRMDETGGSRVYSVAEHSQGSRYDLRRLASDRPAGAVRQRRHRSHPQTLSRRRQKIWLRPNNFTIHGFDGSCRIDENGTSGRSVRSAASRPKGLSASLESAGCASPDVQRSRQHRAGSSLLQVIAEREPA